MSSRDGTHSDLQFLWRGEFEAGRGDSGSCSTSPGEEEMNYRGHFGERVGRKSSSTEVQEGEESLTLEESVECGGAGEARGCRGV